MATIAVGPAMPGIGSWEWLGTELASALQQQHEVKVFRDCVPACDSVLLIKSFPEREDVLSLAERVPVVFCPIDRYGSSADIDRHAPFLSRCARIVIHSATLRQYFQSYAHPLRMTLENSSDCSPPQNRITGQASPAVEYVDHPLKYVTELRNESVADGPILWVGVKNNLPPLVEWANCTQLPANLWVLTDLPSDRGEIGAKDLGFEVHNTVRVGKWSVARHLKWVSQARTVVDVKGDDFRSRHKPPAKAIDFLASGLPLAVNVGHSARRHLAQMGFELADVNDAQRWFSDEYSRECVRFGAALREQCSTVRIDRRMQEILEQAMIQWNAV